MKIFTFLFFPLFFINQPVTRAALIPGNNFPDPISRGQEYYQELQEIKIRSERIHETFSIYELEIIEKEFQFIIRQIEKAESILSHTAGNKENFIEEEFFIFFDSVLISYDKLIHLYDLYAEIERKKEEWNNRYFRLWEEVYHLNTRIDKLFIKEENVTTHYAGMNEQKITVVRKRPLYETCKNSYNAHLMKLKNTGDCDHYERIQILEKLLPILRNCEKLAASDTKELEKSLRRTEDLNIREQLIIEFETQ